MVHAILWKTVCLTLVFPIITGCMIPSGFYSIGSSYRFEDQVLQGEIAGVPFKAVSGYAEAPYFDSTKYSVHIFDISPQAGMKPYDLDAYPNSEVYFSILADIPGISGVHDIKRQRPGFRPVTFEDYGKTSPQSLTHFIATEGAYEVTVDTDAGKISLKFDARVDDDTYVNGTFTIPIRPR